MFRIITAALAGAVFAGLCLGQGGPPDLSKIQLESVIVYLVKQKFSLGLVIPPQVVIPLVPSRQKFQPSAAIERALPKILHAAA